MTPKIRFDNASIEGIVLAKVGNPQREEPLVTSREVFTVEREDQEMLATLFLKPFKNLAGHCFRHHSALEQHEMNNHAKAIFTQDDGLLEHGCDIARRLYDKSTHPNIKSGDLCIALMPDIEVDGEPTLGICILKSESVQPFLSIQTRDGDLSLSTENGINPEKIDKGCLILNHQKEKGFYILTFDRQGSESRFWVRDFLGVRPITDNKFLTAKVAEMARDFASENTPEANAEPEQKYNAANAALAYFDDHETFSMQEYEEKVLRDPDTVAKFKEHKAKLEEEAGVPFEDGFEISRKDIEKARKKVSATMKFDTGVDVTLRPDFAQKRGDVIERGYDESRGMNFVKIYYNEDFAE